MRKITYRMLHWPCWDNLAWKYCLVNVAQICLRQHCTRKLFVYCWAKLHRYSFAEKPAVSNMPDSLFFNWVQYHQTILALFVQCWLRNSFTACGTTMNRTNFDWNNCFIKNFLNNLSRSFSEVEAVIICVLSPTYCHHSQT